MKKWAPRILLGVAFALLVLVKGRAPSIAALVLAVGGFCAGLTIIIVSCRGLLRDMRASLDAECPREEATPDPPKLGALLAGVALMGVSALAVYAIDLRIPRHGATSRAARAYAEVYNIELSLKAIQADAGKKSFGHMWSVNPGFESTFTDPANLETAMHVYQDAFYLLLREGSGADAPASGWPDELKLRDDVRQNLGQNYMDLGNDPWGSRYQFCPGPLPRTVMPFRVYQRDDNIPGLPPEDTGVSMKVGYPAPRDMTVYIFSKGQNLETNQLWSENYDNPDAAPDQVGGGDDINNWDEDQSWRVFYR